MTFCVNDSRIKVKKQYQLIHKGKTIIIEAYHKQQISKKYHLNTKQASDYCNELKYDRTRLIDINLTK